jgi:hypothetical protein
LRFGASLKLWNIVLGLLGGIVAGILVGAGLPPVFMTVVIFIGALLGLWATFVLTTQEPRIALQEDPVTLRKIIRTCALAAIAGNLLEHGGALVSVPAQAPGASIDAWSMFVEVAAGLLGVAGIVVLWGELMYLRRFALRVPDERLAKSTKMLMWVLPITAAVAIVVGLIVAFSAGLIAATPPVGVPAAPTPLAGGAIAGACALGAFALYVGLWYVRLLLRYRRAFATAAADSRLLTLVPAATQPA